MGEREVADKKGEFVSGGLLFNPIAVWAFHCFFSFTIAQVLVAITLDWLFLSGVAPWVTILETLSMCGAKEGEISVFLVACRVFFPNYLILGFFIPFLLLSFIFLCIAWSWTGQKPWPLTQGQRWGQIFTMSILPAILLLWTIKKIPEHFLFTAPIHGFHPFLPITVATCTLFVPLIIWSWIDKSPKFQRRLKHV